MDDHKLFAVVFKQSIKLKYSEYLYLVINYFYECFILGSSVYNTILNNEMLKNISTNPYAILFGDFAI